MVNITVEIRDAYTEIPSNIEVFWAENHEKVVFFKDDDFIDFVNLTSSTNNKSGAVKAALKHLKKD